MNTISKKTLIQQIKTMFGGKAKQLVEITENYTPAIIVAGFVPLLPGDDAAEAAWHMVTKPLATEQIRMVFKKADDGVYYIGAPAIEFANYPNARTPLFAAFPETQGHRGDGAYFVELRGGLVAVVIKKEKALFSNVGERVRVEQYAIAQKSQYKYYPTDAESDSWKSYRELELSAERNLATKIIVTGLVVSALMYGATLGLNIYMGTASAAHEKTLQQIRNTQEITMKQINGDATAFDPYNEYRKLSKLVVIHGGNLNRYEAVGAEAGWSATLPAWVTDISSFGNGVTAVKTATGEIILSKVRKGR